MDGPRQCREHLATDRTDRSGADEHAVFGVDDQFDDALVAGDLVRVEITAAEAYDLTAKVVRSTADVASPESASDA